MSKILCLLGKSGAGKSYIQDLLCKDDKYKKIVSYTTRAMRESETNLVDYNFVPNEVFEIYKRRGLFAEEYTAKNGWRYGFSKESFDVGEDNIAVAVCTPYGLKQIKAQFNNVTAILIECDDDVRYERIHSRESKIDESEFDRRKLQDVIDFEGVDEYIDYIVHNENGLAENVAETIKVVMER